MYVVALVVLGSAELKACVPPRKKKKNNMLCAAVCGDSAAASWNKQSRQHLILFFCSALPLSEGLHSHRLGEKKLLLFTAYHRHQPLFSFWFFILRQQEEKRHKPTNFVIFICGEFLSALLRSCVSLQNRDRH